MPFWSDPSVEPKLSFRWYASFGFGTTNVISSYTLRSFQKPSFEIAASEYLWLNDVAYRPGILTWNPIEITITDVEDIFENNTRKLYSILQRAGYQTADPVNKPKSAIEKKAASEALGNDLRLIQINSSGGAIEEWVLKNPFITTVNFGQANYGAEEIMTISLGLRYDWAEHNIK
jgi:hypothetical protein